MINYISERFLAFSYHLDYMDYQQDSIVGENPPSELRGQLPTGSGTDRARLARCECVSLRLILYLRSHWYPVNPLRKEKKFYAALSARYGSVRVMVSDN